GARRSAEPIAGSKGSTRRQGTATQSGASRENSPTRTRGGRDGPEETRPEAHTSGGGGASGGHESKHDRSSESNAQNQQRLETGLQRPSNGGLRHAGHRRSGHHY